MVNVQFHSVYNIGAKCLIFFKYIRMELTSPKAKKQIKLTLK